MNLLQKIFLISTLAMTLALPTWANKGVAKAIILKGKVVAVNPQTKKETPLKRGSWVEEGFIVKTQGKSFVKFLFIDKSQMNLGPKSEMAISKFPKKEAGIITLMKGSLRSKVTKNYLDNKDKDKSKLFIKTKTAAMGVRGTDFMVSFNPINDNTALVTFSGAVAMAQINETVKNIQVSQAALERVVSGDTAVIVTKGQFSGVSPGKTSRATTPVKINPGQLESMKANDGSKDTPDQAAAPKAPAKKFRNVIPPGVNAKGFSNKANVTDQVEKVLGKSVTIAVVEKIEKEKSVVSESAPPPEGSVNTATGEIAPPAGGYVDLNTAQYVAPPAGSVFDAATETYIPPANFGGFNPETGSYENANYTLTEDGKFVPTADPDRAPASEGQDGSPATKEGQLAGGNSPPELAPLDKPIEPAIADSFAPQGDFPAGEGPLGGPGGKGFNSEELNQIVKDAQDTIKETIEDAEDERNEVLNNSTRVRFNINNSN